MYISKGANLTHTMELNETEFMVMKRMINKLIFNSSGVSNQFKVSNKEIEVINQMRSNLNFVR
jgi:hypothetical protein